MEKPPFDIAEPEPVDGAEPEAAGKEAAGYTGAAERCMNCQNYDDESGQCKKHMEAVEPDGHCNLFAPGGGEEEAEGSLDMGLEGLDEPEELY